MKKNWLRGLAGVLAGLLLLGLIPLAAFALEADQEREEESIPAGLQQEVEEQLAREEEAQEDALREAGFDAMVSTARSGVGIAILTHTAAAVCRDAGEGGIASAVETGGTVLSLWTALPLLRAVLETVQGLL